MSDVYKFELELSRYDLEEEQLSLKENDAFKADAPILIDSKNLDDITKAHFIEPVSIVITVTIAWICKRLVDYWLKDREKGVQIDLRKTPPVVSRIAGTPKGFLIIIDKNGNPKVHKAEYEKGEDLIPVIQALLT
jgi:hypothetical protein